MRPKSDKIIVIQPEGPLVGKTGKTINLIKPTEVIEQIKTILF